LALTPFFMAFSSLSMTLARLGFPAISAVDVLDPLRRRYLLAALQVQAVRFSNLCYFFAQPSDALSDGLLHRDRQAECGSLRVGGYPTQLVKYRHYTNYPVL
jgi:hypothetical protein